MKLNPSSPINFKGYDARPLKGFYMDADCNGIGTEMKVIGDKEGFRVYSTHRDDAGSYKCTEGVPRYKEDTANIWVQDMWTVVKNKLLSYDHNVFTNSIKEFFNLKDDETQQLMREEVLDYNETCEIEDTDENKYHIAGGNVFVVKGNKKDEVIVGKDALENFSLKEIKKMYNVNNLTVLPQMDYHLDLFIRPLDNKRVLLADDEKTLEVLNQGQKKLLDCLKTNPADADELYNILERFIGVKVEFENAVKENDNAKCKQVERILTQKGFEVIKVPGRLYRTTNTKFSDNSDLHHYCNYMNANVLKNKQGDLVYITNKSIVDSMLGLTPQIAEKIGFSFENAFIDSISPFVKPEHIYFVNGDNHFVERQMLMCYQGGIHCACTEIPE